MQEGAEVEAFVRWLAMNPHKLEEYMKNPGAFLDAANVGDEARAAIVGAGPGAIRRAVSAKSEEIYSGPEATAPNTYGRDETATGFGAKR